MTDPYTLPGSAMVEQPHTRARRLAWARYESTPLFDATCTALGHDPIKEARLADLGRAS